MIKLILLDSTIKPDPNRCPLYYCFFFHLPTTCCNPFGRCTRLYAADGDRDWYEPNEVELKIASLPWFYFIPSPEEIVSSRKQEYIEESEKLWGSQHWNNKDEK